MNPELSIIIPFYNSSEALKKNIGYLIENLQLNKYNYEIIVVDDGSKDSSNLKQIANELSLIYLQNEVNQGKGAALRKGFKAAKGEIRIFTDPDIPYKFDAIDRIIHQIRNKEADLVIGNRHAKDSAYFHRVGFVRQWGGQLVSVFFGTLVTGGYYDTQCGIKGFTKDAANNIFEWSSINRFAIDLEIIYLALKFKYKISKIPVVLRSSDGSTVRVLTDGFRLITDVFRMKINYEKKKKKTRKNPT